MKRCTPICLLFLACSSRLLAATTYPEPAKRAGDLYERHLLRQPGDLQARMLTGEFPKSVPERFRLPAAALTSEVPFPRWFDIAPNLGVNAFDLAGGAIIDDFNGDGLLDLVSSSWDPCEPMKAFRNDGKGGFEDVSQLWDSMVSSVE